MTVVGARAVAPQLAMQSNEQRLKAVHHVLVSGVESMHDQLGVNLGSTWGHNLCTGPHRGRAPSGVPRLSGPLT